MSENSYLNLLADVMTYGDRREGRNGVVRSLFGHQLKFDLAQGFPLLTTKKVHFKSIALELLWFISGNTNAKWLEDQGVTIWKSWGDPETREMGPIYGAQWRYWPGKPEAVMFNTELGGYTPGIVSYPIDQLQGVIDSLKSDPFGRRHIVSAWNPTEIPDMALPPCHCLFQFFVTSDARLHCQLYQRSADLFLGIPFNIASYALLTHLVGQVTGLTPGQLIITFGDVHLYEDHLSAAATQLGRSALPLPTISVAQRQRIDDYVLGDFTLQGYEPYPAIPAPVSK